MMFEIQHKVWDFSLALEGVNKSNPSYLDVRDWFSVDAEIHTKHLIALTTRLN